jgi:hypothetical protein
VEDPIHGPKRALLYDKDAQPSAVSGQPMPTIG